MTEILIEANDAGQTLEKYLRKAFSRLPGSMMHKAIRNKKIKVNRRRCQEKQVLQAGDSVQLFLPPDVLETQDFVPNDRPLNIQYEDDDILVAFKPGGLLSQKDQPGEQDDLNGRLRTNLYRRGLWDPEKDRSFRPAAAHRLDRNTSGLVLCSKSAQGARHLSELIQNKEVAKHYHARVQGDVKEAADIRLYLKKEGTRAVVRDTPAPGYQEAVMSIRPLARDGQTTLLDVDLETGRFHQIRACMAHLGHPLQGDVKYGGTGSGGYFLQAYRLDFDGKTVTYQDVK